MSTPDRRTDARWWRRRRDELLAAARTAQQEAAVLLYTTDRDLNDCQAGVAAYIEVNPGPEADRLRADWTPIADRSAAAIAAYMDAIALYDTAKDLETDRAATAHDAFSDARLLLADAHTDTARFADRWADELTRGRGAAASAPAQAAKALTAAQAARRAVEAAEAEGWSTGPADGHARAAADLARQANQPGSIRSRLTAASQAVDQATRAVHATEALPTDWERLTRRVRSLRTRLQAVATQTAAADAHLKALAIGYLAASWSEVRTAPGTARESLSEARDAIAQAEAVAAASPRDPEELARLVYGPCTAHLDAAQAAARAVAERRAALDAAAADPTAPLRAARFAVRDAARLITNLPAPRAAGLAREIDGLAATLDRAETALREKHRPDWGHYIDVISHVTNHTKDIVARARHAARHDSP